eukprot:5216556-Pyramimonas_sp.AAC.1
MATACLCAAALALRCMEEASRTGVAGVMPEPIVFMTDSRGWGAHEMVGRSPARSRPAWAGDFIGE